MAKCVRPPKTSRKKLEAMDEKEFDKWLFARMDTCQCQDCPTHNECAKRSAERLYCVASRSPVCIEQRQGCLCHDCPVFEEVGLTQDYHCLEGPEIKRG
ncbi:MAG: DUF2769 domain-containing protein [Methanomassiliicoccales archaeon]|jgi:hypothetical protein|nr:DUF2769 domain-containing protein [Methanomassiliicoccales archaeon]